MASGQPTPAASAWTPFKWFGICVEGTPGSQTSFAFFASAQAMKHFLKPAAFSSTTENGRSYSCVLKLSAGSKMPASMSTAASPAYSMLFLVLSEKLVEGLQLWSTQSESDAASHRSLASALDLNSEAKPPLSGAEVSASAPTWQHLNSLWRRCMACLKTSCTALASGPNHGSPSVTSHVEKSETASSLLHKFLSTGLCATAGSALYCITSPLGCLHVSPKSTRHSSPAAGGPSAGTSSLQHAPALPA
jgi:hypothetical protein